MGPRPSEALSLTKGAGLHLSRDQRKAEWARAQAGGRGWWWEEELFWLYQLPLRSARVRSLSEPRACGRREERRARYLSQTGGREFTSKVGWGSVAGSDACLIFWPEVWREHSERSRLTPPWPWAAAWVRVRRLLLLGLGFCQVSRTGRGRQGAEEGDGERKKREVSDRRRSEEDLDKWPGVGWRFQVRTARAQRCNATSGDPVWVLLCSARHMLCVLKKPSKNYKRIVPRAEALDNTEKNKKRQKSPVISVNSIKS